MASQREEREKLEGQIAGKIPSAIPVNITKGSYARMIAHSTFKDGVWKCGSTGGQIKAKMLYMNVYNKHTNQWEARVPVAHLYCSVCEKAPQVKAGDSIFNTDVGTYYL